jgi:transcriptional regulator with PAS, ATPase and Fis domain
MCKSVRNTLKTLGFAWIPRHRPSGRKPPDLVKTTGSADTGPMNREPSEPLDEVVEIAAPGSPILRIARAFAGDAEPRARRAIFGDSPPMRELIDQIQRVARIPRPILITGERGTGKELVARAIHFASGRPAGKMV